jgi:hypothetical protein
VVVLSLGAKSEKDAQIMGGVKRANGLTIEFTSREGRDLVSLNQSPSHPQTTTRRQPPTDRHTDRPTLLAATGLLSSPRLSFHA